MLKKKGWCFWGAGWYLNAHYGGGGRQGNFVKKSWILHKNLSSAKYLHKILCHQANTNPKKINVLKAYSSETIFDTWKPFRNDENCFLFHLKKPFHSQDIEIFVMTFWSCRKNGLIRKIRLISKSITSQPG